MKRIKAFFPAFLLGFLRGKFINAAPALAGVILAIMFFFLVGSAWNDAATFDETAHIPAGFGYIAQLDYRLNPEHPPLIKALSAASAWLFVRPYFPTNVPSWTDYVEGNWQQQFRHGHVFLYESGNNADRIIFWSRIPVMLLTVGFGWLLFRWTRKRFGSTSALILLSLYALSPTILAHGRFVTTDVAAALGFFIGIAAFIRFLEHPSGKNFLLAGIAFGVAQLLKYSLVLLVPMYALMLIGWAWSRPNLRFGERLRSFSALAVKTIGIGLAGLAVVWLAYGLFTLGYPPERQYRDISRTLQTNSFTPGVNAVSVLIRRPATAPLGQYFFGVLMAGQRVEGGNTTVFLNEVSSKGSRLYFPLLYLVKEPLALHILAVIALWFGVRSMMRSKNTDKRTLRLRAWVRDHFIEASAWIMIAVYWLISVASPLNIGIRHVLPTFPFIYLLTANGISRWLFWHDTANPATWFSWLENMYQQYIASVPKFLFVVFLLLLMLASDTALFPSYLSFYNILGGGARNGYAIAVDSNYDWGQDLKRLADFVRAHNISRIALDYFGGGDPKYYMGDAYEPWWSAKGPAHGWFAISISTREGAWGRIGPGFERKPEDSYEWLKQYQPAARVGTSLFIYQLP